MVFQNVPQWFCFGYLIRKQSYIVNVELLLNFCFAIVCISVSRSQDCPHCLLPGVLLLSSTRHWKLLQWESPETPWDGGPGSSMTATCVYYPLRNQIRDAFYHRLRTGAQVCEILYKRHSLYVFIAYKMPGECPSKSNMVKENSI